MRITGNERAAARVRRWAGAAGAMTLGASALVAGVPGAASAATTLQVQKSGSSDANPCTPAQPCLTINRALAVAANGDTIAVGPGLYAERLVVTKGVTIVGSGAGSTTIEAPASPTGPVVSVQITAGKPTLTVTGFTLQKGNTAFGGGVSVLFGHVALADDVVTNNTATGPFGGGGIGLIGTQFAAQGPTSLTLTRVTVSGNKTTAGHGGGMFVAGAATVTDCTISGNTSAGVGGGVDVARTVAADTPTFTIADSGAAGAGTAVTGNTAGTKGGGLNVDAGGAFNAGPQTSISTNTSVNGGAMNVVEGGIAVLDGTTVNGNKANGAAIAAGGNAGAILNAGSLTIKNHATLSGNQAVASTNTSNPTRGFGGAIFNVSFAGGSPALTITDSSIVGGLPAGQFNATSGGGIAQFSPVPATITNSSLTGNVGFFGGALYASRGATVTGSTITGNLSVQGGGVYVASSPAAAVTTIAGGTVGSNTAAQGGGAFVQGKGTAANAGALTLTGAAVTNNVADGTTSPTGGNGGGVFAAGTLTIDGGSTLAGNYLKLSTASGAVTGIGGNVFVGPAAAGDAPSAVITDSSVAGGTLPAGVTNNARLGGGVAVMGNVFGITGSPAPAAGALTAARDAIAGNRVSAYGGGLFTAAGATVSDSTFGDNVAAIGGGNLAAGPQVASDTAVLTTTNVTINGGTSVAIVGGGIAVLAKATLNSTGGSIASSTAALGGGLYVQEGGAANLDGTAVTNNKATGTNGGSGGGIYNAGATTVVRSVVSGNQSVRSGSSGGFGGAIYSGSNASSPATVTLSLTGDTVSGNTSSGGSAIFTSNGASAGTANTATITNSTIAANAVTGNVSAGSVVAFHPLTITGSTIVGNTAAAASGGIYGTATTVAGTILFGNTGPSCGAGGLGLTRPIDGGYNLVPAGDGSCAFSAANHDLFGHPQLGTLGANGGPTPTMQPGPSSPAINAIPAGTAVLCAGAVADQRRVARPIGSGCDIGSVETDLFSPTLGGPDTPAFVVGASPSSFGYTTTGVPTAGLSLAGALPTGITFVDNGNGTATLAGAAPAGTAGLYPVTITAANGFGSDAALAVTIHVNQKPAVTGPGAATEYAKRPMTPATFTATGFPLPALTETGALPAGISFVDNGDGTATLLGTTTDTGTFPITVTAANGVSPDATTAFTLTVKPAVAIATATVPDSRVGVFYDEALQATGGLAPYTWTVTSGSLPPGLSLAASGRLSGTVAGPVSTSTFTVLVTDSLAAPAGTDSITYTIGITRGPTSLTIDPVGVTVGNIVHPSVGTITAHLAAGFPLVPFAGQTLTFKAGSTTVCTAVTDANGNVTCTLSTTNTVLVVTSGGVDGSYAGNALYNPATDHAGLAST